MDIFRTFKLAYGRIGQIETVLRSGSHHREIWLGEAPLRALSSMSKQRMTQKSKGQKIP